MILPQIEGNEGYQFLSQASDEFKTPRWWMDSDPEKDAAEAIIPIFICPSDSMGDRNKKRNFFGNHGKSNYAGVIGPKLEKELKHITNLSDLGSGLLGAISTPEEQLKLEWPGILYPNSAVELKKITDGMSKTLLLVSVMANEVRRHGAALTDFRGSTTNLAAHQRTLDSRLTVSPRKRQRLGLRSVAYIPAVLSLLARMARWRSSTNRLTARRTKT